jgi:GntR family transcriptional regulator, galactonate operon transcriptional repressor
MPVLQGFARSVVEDCALPLRRKSGGERAQRVGGLRPGGRSEAVVQATRTRRRQTARPAASPERDEATEGPPVARRRVNDSLAAVLGYEIIAGLHPPGARLPTEARLLVRFGVSRPTLREAFRALEAKGLIVSRQKVGTLVRPKSEWHMLDSDFLAWHMLAAPTEEFVNNVFQLRRIFEPQAAAIAAEIRDAASLEIIEAAYADMERYKTGDGDLIGADVRFHKAILSATGNGLLAGLGSLIEMALVGTFRMGWRNPAIKDDRLHQHRDVMRAIVAQQPAAAQAAMAKLLGESAEDVRRALIEDRAVVAPQSR